MTTEAADQHFAIGFITALVSKELTKCEAVLKARGWQEEPVQRFWMAGIVTWSKIISERKVIAYTNSMARMGQTFSALETYVFLERCRPTLVYLTGIAGSLDEKKIKKEDVVVALRTFWRGQNKIRDKIRDDGSVCDGYRTCEHGTKSYSHDFNLRLERYLAQLVPSARRKWNIHPAAMLTWDYVVDSKRVVERLNDRFHECACVEMEAGGFFAAVDRYKELYNPAARGHVIKGISDYASNKDSDEIVRGNASANAANVAITLAEWMATPTELQFLKEEIYGDKI